MSGVWIQRVWVGGLNAIRGGLALRANMMSILTSAKVISAKVITDWPKGGHQNQSGLEFDGESKSGDSHRGGSATPKPKVWEIFWNA